MNTESIQIVDHLVMDVLAKAQAVQEAITLLAVAQEALSTALKSNLTVYERLNVILTPVVETSVVMPVPNV